MFVVKQVYKREADHVIVLANGPGIERILEGGKLRAGSRTWDVTTKLEARAFAVMGPEPTPQLELKCDGDPVDARELARSAKIILSLAKAAQAIDVPGTVKACGSGLEQLTKAAQAIGELQVAIDPDYLAALMRDL